MLDKLATIDSRYSELERLMADPEIAVDYSRVQELAREMASLKDVAALSCRYRKATQDAADAREIARDESDREMAALARDELAELEAEKQALEDELRVALSAEGPQRCQERHRRDKGRHGRRGGRAVRGRHVPDVLPVRSAPEAGSSKSSTATRTASAASRRSYSGSTARGPTAASSTRAACTGCRGYRSLSPAGRIHTSAATVAVLPEAEEVDVEVDPEDLQIDIFHSSGHGGQNVQKVATAVRITHIPTGIVAVCQDERSQYKNKEKAMSVLRSRLLAMEIRKQQEEVSEARRSQVGSGDRSERVRTYNFPQDRVTDHRVSLTRHNLAGILDGEIDPFVDALTDHEQTRMLQDAGL